MPIRNRHKIGDHLMLDDESGFVKYRSEMRRLWDGTWRHKDSFETRQPQEFVRARNDPKPLRYIRPEPLAASPVNQAIGCVGKTNVQRPMAPGGHLFSPGIGGMVIQGANQNTVFKVGRI